MNNMVKFSKLLVKIVGISFILLTNKTYTTIDSPAAERLILQLTLQALKNQLGFNTNITEKQKELTQQSAEILANQEKIADGVSAACNNQSANCKKKRRRITKFSTEGFDFGGFDAVNGHIEDGTGNINTGLDVILDATLEIADSLVGARSLLKKAQKVFKKYQKIKRPSKPIQTIIIELSGTYKINEDIRGGIIIDSDNVTLDLDQHKIQGHFRSPIIITGGKKNVTIKNGIVEGGEDLIAAPSGILINRNSESIEIKDILFTLCEQAITFHGLEGRPIKNCSVKNCIFERNRKALYLQYTQDSTFEACKLIDCLDNDVENIENKNNFFEKCEGLKVK